MGLGVGEFVLEEDVHTLATNSALGSSGLCMSFGILNLLNLKI